MTNTPDSPAAIRLEWLSKVAEDTRTTERHYAAAEALSTTSVAPDEHVAAADELVELGHLFKGADSRYTPAHNRWKRVQ